MKYLRFQNWWWELAFNEAVIIDRLCATICRKSAYLCEIYLTQVGITEVIEMLKKINYATLQQATKSCLFV